MSKFKIQCLDTSFVKYCGVSLTRKEKSFSELETYVKVKKWCVYLQTNMSHRKKHGYLFVPYHFLKRNKNSVFANRFRLYKKKECERIRRYKVNTVKPSRHLDIVRKKHRCSYCRSLYWTVAYYRGYMLCTFCFQKKSVISYILFNNYDHDICVDDVVSYHNLNNNDMVDQTTTTSITPISQISSTTSTNANDIVGYNPMEAPHGRVFVRCKNSKKGYIEISLNDYIPTSSTTMGMSTYEITPSYFYNLDYNHEYWTYIGLHLFRDTNPL